MAFEAAEHAAVDPELNDYKRPYLTPYRQKHPTTDHQYTLYFLVISKQELFVAWINDRSCLHDTRSHHSDPCLKEFRRLQSKSEIETYDPNFHKVHFDTHPNKQKPFQCRSSYLGYETTLNTFFEGAKFIGHAFYCSEPEPDIAKIHVREFLMELHQHLMENRIDLEIRFIKLGHETEVDLISGTADMKKWQIVNDTEDFILRKL